MDTSCILCPISDIRITLHSVIQTRTLCLWDNLAISLSSHFVVCATCTKRDFQRETNRYTSDRVADYLCTLCAICTKILTCLDVIESQEYDGGEKQGIKNSLRIFLQGTEAILPGNWETLSSSESAKHRAFSPCKPDTHNALDSAAYIDAQTVELFTGRLFKSRLTLWFREMSGFFIAF